MWIHRMKAIKKNHLLLGAVFFTAGCWTYSLATRFTDFLFASKTDKILIFTSLLMVASLLSAWLYWVLLAPFFRAISRKTFAIVLGISGVAIAVLFSNIYQLPPFPEHHQLTITVLKERNPVSIGSEVEIISLSTVSLPDQKHKRIPVNQLDLEGNWQGSNNGYGILTNKAESTSARFQRFMQAGMIIEFQTGPQSGMVRLEWDGNGQTLDLYSHQTGIYSAVLKPSLDWRRADLTRKILVAGAVISDFLGITALLASIVIIGHQLFSGHKLTIRQPGLLLLCLVLIVMLQFAVLKINKEVVFKNPQIEAVVRKVLNKPTGGIYQYQLLTIVKLDASSRKITDLDGIEQLPNLMQLTLRNNQISNITPISRLKFLKKLNLRDNGITDLSPLSQLTGLIYLNIYSNPAIESIEPLKNLIKLRTLIMGNVLVRNELNVLENFQNLTYLNMRNCGVDDLKPFSNLKKLEYLNLFSNPKISTIKPLENLTNLQSLILANIPVNEELNILGSLTKLKYLNLRNAKLTDISPLAQLTKLEYLNLHSNPEIISIEPISDLTKLQTLILRNVPIGNQVGLLSGFPDLQNLNIRNCGVTDISVLGGLMAKGALQDNRKSGVLADVDIRDNMIPRDSKDEFAAIRPYWEKITYRDPIALPFFAALRAPQFSQPAGFYEASFLLELSTDEPDARIYYTLDGAEPTQSSHVYSKPILIASRAGEANGYSAIESIAADWHKPKNEVTKATVVRAKVIGNNQKSNSATITHTYFTGADLMGRYNLPVVSLVTDPKNFFDAETGIYVLGKPYADQADADITEDERQLFANFSQHGRAWERPISIELLEDGGQTGFAQNGGVRIHGGGSRRYPQKTLRFYARSEYDLQEFFDYPLFTGPKDNIETQPVSVYKTFLLRNSGQDWMKSMFRDAFVQSLVSNTRLDTQADRPVVAFLNGEYWGIYNLQERYDEFYLTNHYGIDPEQAVILRQNGVLFRGNPDDENQYSALLSFIRKNSLSDQKNYGYIQTQMDVENYIDYLIAEIYAGNDDWPDNNIFLWRMKTDQYEPDAPYGQDGRWRWMLFDLDFGFGLKGGDDDYKLDTIEVAKQPGWSGFLFRSLLENEQFKSEFINRFADQLNTSYTPERVVSILDQTQEVLRPEMDEFIQRWEAGNYSVDEWKKEVEVMRTFALKRPEAMRQHIVDQFGLEGTALLTVKTDPEMGYVKVNSVGITPETTGVVNPAEWSGVYFKGVPVTISAVPKPGFKFSGWEGTNQEGMEINLKLENDLTLSPVFIED
jgi:hypothetical protein